MKTFLFSLLAACTLFAARAPANCDLPKEVSALLLDSSYQQILDQQKQAAQQTGLTLHITSFDVLELPPARYVNVMLATSFSADVGHELTPAGSIVGSVVYGPLGEVGFDGIYFKPAGEGPGGASVGNN